MKIDDDDQQYDPSKWRGRMPVFFVLQPKNRQNRKFVDKSSKKQTNPQKSRQIAKEVDKSQKK